MLSQSWEPTSGSQASGPVSAGPERSDGAFLLRFSSESH